MDDRDTWHLTILEIGHETSSKGGGLSLCEALRDVNTGVYGRCDAAPVAEKIANYVVHELDFWDSVGDADQQTTVSDEPSARC